VFEVLQQVAADGVPQEAVDAALHQLELSEREITGDGFPYGLHLLMEALDPGDSRRRPAASAGQRSAAGTVAGGKPRPGFHSATGSATAAG
jgi:hypothetical protein